MCRKDDLRGPPEQACGTDTGGSVAAKPRLGGSGGTESEVGAHFIREQALIRNLVTADSQLRWLRLSGTQSPRVLAEAAITFATNAM